MKREGSRRRTAAAFITFVQESTPFPPRSHCDCGAKTSQRSQNLTARCAGLARQLHRVLKHQQSPQVWSMAMRRQPFSSLRIPDVCTETRVDS